MKPFSGEKKAEKYSKPLIAAFYGQPEAITSCELT